MTPFLKLASARTAGGAELSLYERPPHFYLRVNGQPLMATNAVESEAVLAEAACAQISPTSAARVLIGGLGFGFTLRRVLELVSPKASVEVAELLPEVVAWNREFLGAVNGPLLDDPRVVIHIADVWQVLVQAPRGHFDAVLLDVDNGPTAMVQQGNNRLYQAAGLAEIVRTLKPRGCVTIWSASADPAFAKRLGQAGLTVSTKSAKAHAHAKRDAHVIYVGKRPG